MSKMTYEISVKIPVKITLTQEEREEACAYGIERGWLHQEDIDKGYEDLDYDVIHERAIMGRDEDGDRFRLMADEVKDAVSDWLDEHDGLDVVIEGEFDVSASEEDDDE